MRIYAVHALPDISNPVADAAQKDTGVPVVTRDDPVPGCIYMPVPADLIAADAKQSPQGLIMMGGKKMSMPGCGGGT